MDSGLSCEFLSPAASGRGLQATVRVQRKFGRSDPLLQIRLHPLVACPKARESLAVTRSASTAKRALASARFALRALALSSSTLPHSETDKPSLSARRSFRRPFETRRFYSCGFSRRPPPHDCAFFSWKNPGTKKRPWDTAKGALKDYAGKHLQPHSTRAWRVFGAEEPA